jgi:hypothetical protein
LRKVFPEVFKSSWAHHHGKIRRKYEAMKSRYKYQSSSIHVCAETRKLQRLWSLDIH